MNRQPRPQDFELTRGERLRIAIHYLVSTGKLQHGHQTQLARHFGVSRQAVSRIVGAELTRRQGGQVLVMFCATFSVLMLMVAFAIDQGLAYGMHGRAQQAADSAALAGAAAYLTPGNTDADAVALARTYARFNGAEATVTTMGDCTTTDGTTYAGMPSVQVIIEASSPLLFTALPAIDVSAGAVACPMYVPGGVALVK